jgi:monoamine oxidase
MIAMKYADFVRLHERFGSTGKRLTRRSLLQTGLALTTSAPLLASKASSPVREDAPLKGLSSRQTHKRVVVVGAGLSGLACAYELNALGYDVVVIEARDRLGGRVHSLRDLAKGEVIEAGGEFIGSNHPLWLRYARKFKLVLAKGSSGEEQGSAALVVEGRVLTAREAKHLYQEMDQAFAGMTQDARPIMEANPWKSPRAESLDGRSIADWISDQTCTPRCKQALHAYFTGLNGVETERQSYLAMLAVVKGGGLKRYWTDSEVYRCRGGNEQLAGQFAKSVKNVWLGLPVRAIHLEAGRAVVTCTNGKIFEADDVVLTTPPSVWDKIVFSPTLPKVLLPQMGANVKYLAVVRRRFWHDHKMAPEANADRVFHSVWEGSALSEGHENAVLTAFAGGHLATNLHQMTADERERACTKQMEAIFSGFQQNFLHARFVDWLGDPWAQGSYSFPAPGQVVTMGPLLSEAYQGRLHFAGEHTCLKFVGYMEGALQSGVSVAQRIGARDGISQQEK